MLKLLRIFSTQKKLLRQQIQQTKDIKQLIAELEKLQTQNDSMRDGMRRCVTCDYRIDVKQRQQHATDTTNFNSHSNSNINSNINNSE
ncbi:MAG: hypothetical protein ACI90U_001281 [Pseudomonadales bacterium]|jgi:uncharacterized protein with PIN domain